MQSAEPSIRVFPDQEAAPRGSAAIDLDDHASPWPPPEQIAVHAKSAAAAAQLVATSSDGAPEAPMGCPSAMARVHVDLRVVHAQHAHGVSATEAKASLISNRSMSSTERPAFSSAALVALAGVRAR